MTDLEIEISDKILHFAKDNSIHITNQNFKDLFGDKCGLAARLCETLGNPELRLLNPNGSNGFFSISELGKEVEKNGLQKYFLKQKEEKRLDIESKIATIESLELSRKSLKKSKIAIWIAVVAIIISIALFVLDKL